MKKFLNNYILGDNLEIIKNINKETVDLIYIDPPFATNRDFGDFNDKWKDLNVFCNDFMKPRVIILKDLLKKSGTFVIHCDTAASHYLKIMCDEVFGINNFKNEIIWVTGGHAKTKRKLYKTHDVLFVYTKSNKSKFNPIYLPYDDEYYKKNTVKFCDIHKKEYITCAIHSAQPNVVPRPNLRYEWNGHEKQWLVTKEKLKSLHEDNRLQYNKKGIPRIKRFLSEMDGIPIKDVWTDINSIQSGEKMDYATQKPVKLVERIITLYTDVDDLVLDCFAGCGTTGRGCLNLNRNYILIDKNEKGKKLFDKSLEAYDNSYIKFLK